MSAQDLIPLNRRTKAEQKAIATKGGIKSGQVRRRKRDMRELCNEILNTVITDEELADKLIKAGVDDTYGGLMLFRAIQGAHESPQMLDKVLTLAGYNCQRIEQVIDDKRDWPRLRVVFDDGENLCDVDGNKVTEEEWAKGVDE